MPVHPVNVAATPELSNRNRLTCAFRLFLAIPHLILVGSPAAFGMSLGWHTSGEPRLEWSAGTGVLGAVAGVCALIAWFVIVFGGRYPEGLWRLATVYLRWRVRAVAYTALLCDAYPPFGDGAYPATLVLERPDAARNRPTVAFRLLLALPQLIALCVLTAAWAFTTVIAWLSILFTGNYPALLYKYGVNVLRWSARVEAYVLLLCDEYPPFSFSE